MVISVDVLHRAAKDWRDGASVPINCILGIRLRNRADDALLSPAAFPGAKWRILRCFSESTETVLQYLRDAAWPAFLLAASHFIFAYHFGLMLLGLGRQSTVPTFLNPVEAEDSEAHV